MAGIRTSAAEYELRITEVQKLYLLGHTTREIVALTKHWNVSDKTIDKYISEVKRRVNEISKDSLPELKDKILSNYWKLYRAAEIRDDVKECHRLLVSIAKIGGLDKVHLNVNVTNERQLKDLSNDELLAAIGKDKDEEDKS